MSDGLTKLKIVEAAYRLIELEEHWTTHAYARTGHNFEDTRIDVLSPKAFCFCSAGALMSAYCRITGEKNPLGDSVDEFLNEFAVLAGFHLNSSDASYSDLSGAITFFNDSQPHSKVKAMFERVIDQLKERNASDQHRLDHPQGQQTD